MKICVLLLIFAKFLLIQYLCFTNPDWRYYELKHPTVVLLLLITVVWHIDSPMIAMQKHFLIGCLIAPKETKNHVG